MIFLPIPNGRRVARARLPAREGGDWARELPRLLDRRPVGVLPLRRSDSWQLIWVVAEDSARRLLATSVIVRGDRIRMLGSRWPAASQMERPLPRLTGLKPDRGPLPGPVRPDEADLAAALSRALDPDTPDDRVIATRALGPPAPAPVEPPTPGYRLGPVHGRSGAPMVLRLDNPQNVQVASIELGFCHRGLVEALRHADPPGAVALAGSLAGDAVIAATLAWCELLEGLAGVEVPPQVALPRATLLELERCGSHFGTLGAVMEAIGHERAAVALGRLREQLRQMMATATGNRLGRGVLWPGGLVRNLNTAGLADRLRDLEGGLTEAEALVETTWSMSRLEGLGIVSGEEAQGLGMVGPAARASGSDKDIRVHFPTGAWWEHPIRNQSQGVGDTLARVRVLLAELGASVRWLAGVLPRLGPATAPAPLRIFPDSLGISLIESARGELALMAVTDSAGQLLSVEVHDPTVKNVAGVELALRGAEPTDIPAILQSFNLSPAGYDR